MLHAPLPIHTQVQSVFVPFPPVSEQRAIAAYLDEETAKLDALVAKVETAMGACRNTTPP